MWRRRKPYLTLHRFYGTVSVFDRRPNSARSTRKWNPLFSIRPMPEFRTLNPKMESAVQYLSWGAVLPSENVKSTVSFFDAPFSTHTYVCLHVRAIPRHGILYLNGDKYKHITFPLSPLDIVSKVMVSSQYLDYAANNDMLDVMLTDAIKSAVRAAAPRLYEADPRIGTCDRTYPRLPLFDPPNGVESMRSIPGCPLCEEKKPDSEGSGYRAWGGGNLGWVHPSCLANVYP